MELTTRLTQALLYFAAAFLFALAPVHAAPPVAGAANGLEHDLGQGLAYHRIHELPADLPTRPAPRSCVVDVRYVQADARAAAAFLAWLTFHASPRAPVFVLANGATGGPLLTALGAREPRRTFMVVGIAARNFQPDLAVRASAEDERRAYDAFAEGVALAVLLADNPHKIRHDEASLSYDRGPESAARDSTPDGPPPPPIDAPLQRAMHLHRALQALKKI